MTKKRGNRIGNLKRVNHEIIGLCNLLDPKISTPRTDKEFKEDRYKETSSAYLTACIIERIETLRQYMRSILHNEESLDREKKELQRLESYVQNTYPVVYEES